MTHVSERPSVVVQHVTSGDVEHHIKKLHTTKNRRSMKPTLGLTQEFINDVNPTQKRKSTASVRFESSHKQDDVDMVEAIENSVEIKKLSGDVDECMNELAGLSVYGFKTPKRAKQMAKYASKSVKKTLKKKSSNETKEGVKDSKNPAVDASTPNKNLRPAKKFSIQAVTVPLDESDESESSDSDHTEKDEENVMRSAKKSTASKRCDVKTSAKRLELPSETELYFDAHKGRTKQSASTSDRTLAKMGGLNMDLEKMQHILGKYKNVPQLIRAQEKLVQNHRQQFRKWMFHICCGYNILLYGLGSKRKLIHEFCDKMLSNHTKVVINGYFPNLTIKSILNAISEEVLGKFSVFGHTQLSQVDTICSHFSDEDGGRETESSHLFLIIHNIDGMTLRNNKVQTILSQLASCSRIHLIASMDHINGSLIWNQSKLCKYKWVWFDATTYEHYVDETSYEHSLLQLTSGAGIGGSLALTGLLHVARSLTPNARGIFKLLAEYQIEESKSNPNNYIGLSFSDLYQQCRQKFLVNSELTLRTQLTEFVDHKLVLIKKERMTKAAFLPQYKLSIEQGGDGAEYLSIPLDESTLQEYLDQALA